MLQESKTNELEYQRLSKEEMEQRGILGRLVGICASFTAPTRNGRKYPEKLWENVFNDPIMKERIENGVCYGELGHPADREETDMEKIAVCMAEQPKKGKDGKLRAVFDILNTPNGRILKSLCDYGSTLGISSRGSGDLETDFDGNESVNPDTYNCEGFDVVLIPAVKEARLQYVTEALDKKRYNKTLRDKLTESINKETEENQRVMKESLDALGIDLTEANDRKLSTKDFYFANDEKEFDGQPQELSAVELQKLTKDEIEQILDSVPVGSKIHNIYGVYWTKKTLAEGNVPEESSVEKKQSIKQNYFAPVPTKYYDVYWSVNGTENPYIINTILGKDKYYIVSDGVNFNFNESLDEGMQYNDYDITVTDSNVIVRDSKGNFIQEFPTEEEAQEWLNEISLNESTYLSKDWKTLKVGDEVTWTSKEFDGSTKWDCEVKNVYPDHIIISPIDAKFNDMSLWIDDDTINEALSLEESKLSPEDKMDAWHAGTRRENIGACGDAKLWKYKEICEYKGYANEVEIINKELQKRGLLDDAEEDTLVLSNDDNFVSISSSIPQNKVIAKMQNNQLLIANNQAGCGFLERYRENLDDFGLTTVDGDEYFVIEKTDPDANIIARGVIATLNESYIIRTLTEAWGFHAKYEVHAYPTGKDVKLAGANDLADAEQLGIKRVNHILDNPWMTPQQKYDYIKTIYIADMDTETEMETSQFGDYVDKTLTQLETQLNEELVSNDNVPEVAADADGAMLEELQKLLSANKQLQDKIITLQEKLSVSYTKEMSLKEELNAEKLKSVKLSNTVSETDALNEQLALAKKNETTLGNKCTKLAESIERKNAKLQQLVEQVANKDKQLTNLTQQLQENANLLTEKTHLLETVTEKYDVLNKDYQQMKENYSKKIEKQNTLVEKYRDVAVKSVNKYIDTQATRLGVTSAEIKNRLPESYSFSDIDRICEDLQEYKLNISNLPFSTGKKMTEGLNVRAANIDTRTLIPMEEDLDDLTLRLAGL